MRWFHNISFSSSSSCCTAVWGKHFEDNNQNPHRSKGRQHYLGFRIAGARLRRQKEQEVPQDKKEAAVLSPRSCTYDTPSTFSPSNASKATSSSALAVPLPLPVPEGDGEQRLPSPKTFAAHYKGLEDRYAVESQITPMVSREFASRDSRKTTKNVEQICSRMSQQEVNKGDKNVEQICSRMSQQEVNKEDKNVEQIGSRMSQQEVNKGDKNVEQIGSRMSQQEVNKGDSYQDEYMVHFPISSAPTSQFGSPVGTPHGMSAVDMFQHYMGNQVWSAPEMNALDVTALPSRACYDYNAFTADNTPLHSPPNRSPRRKNRSHSGPPSLIHHMLSLESIEISSSRPESSSPISVHPLPLPPGAAMSSPSASIPQLVNKPETCFMNCQWQKGKLIGRGTFGSVYVASNRETGALCAMKEVDIFPDDPKSAESIKQLEQEIKVLSHLKHPNIVQYYGSEIAEDKFYIFLEYVHPGSINKYVRDHCGAITESVARNFTRHILCGLAYLHSTKTIHRDIKGANLLVDASGVVKLADFGMSKHLSGQRANLSLKGSPYWMAPELMQAVMQKDNSCELALAVDIWSLGCTIIEMFTGKAPWSEYEGAAAMFKVMRDTPSIPESLSPEGKDFLRCCFQRNPAERPSASVLLEHRFVRSPLQSSAASSPSSFTDIKFTEAPISPGERSEFKLAQLPVQQSLHSPKTVNPDYETAQRSAYKLLELTVAPRHSPRSHLEIPPGLSPNSHHPSPSGTTDRCNNQDLKKNHIFG